MAAQLSGATGGTRKGADVGVAVVVSTRDRPELLRDLLPGLIDAQRGGAEVVVVDSASRGPETQLLAVQSGLRVVRCDLPGASRARNAGVAATAAPVIVMTDDDCRPRAGWLSALESAFGDPTVGFATGRVLPGAGSGRAMSPMDRTEPATWRPGDDVDDMGHGACVAFRRTAFAAVGGFDEVLGAGGPLHASEEKDVFWRMLQAGWEGRFVPDAVVEHAAWRGQREALRNGYRYGIGMGARIAKVARIEGAPPGRAVRRKCAATLRQLPETVRAGYRFATLNIVVRAVGILVGGRRARRYQLKAGRYVG
jgi:glycosyltransferase involved in cell wall biosynthesis